MRILSNIPIVTKKMNIVLINIMIIMVFLIFLLDSRRRILLRRLHNKLLGVSRGLMNIKKGFGIFITISSIIALGYGLNFVGALYWMKSTNPYIPIELTNANVAEMSKDEIANLYMSIQTGYNHMLSLNNDFEWAVAGSNVSIALSICLIISIGFNWYLLKNT